MKNKNIKKLIKKLHDKTTPQMDAKILNDVLKRMQQPKRTKPTAGPTNIWRIIVKSRITKLAAAAVIIIAVCLFFTQDGPNKKVKTQEIAQTTKSPAELTTIASLNFAYRDGDMEAMEKQFDEAQEKVKPMLKERITIDQLICELEECEET